MKHKIEQYFKSKKSYASRHKYLKENFPELLEKVKRSDLPFAQALYDELYLDSTRPTCRKCGKAVKFESFDEGYKRFCGIKCSNSYTETVDKRKQTSYERFGVSNPLKSTDIRNQREKTLLERWGVVHPLQNETLKQKAKASNKRTWENNSDAITQKKKKTILQKWGVENLWDSDEFRNRVIQANRTKWGTDWVQQNRDVLSKRVNTRRQNMLDALQKRFPELELLADSQTYTGINRYQGGSAYMWRCKNCGNEFEDYISFTHWPLCTVCYPTTGNSNGEAQLAAFLSDLNISFKSNDRNLIYPREVDFLIPDHSVAIEYNGLYWHSTNKIPDHKYHWEKWKQCRDKGYQLITIFEDEWLNKPEICKNRIKHILGVNHKTCGARQCDIHRITSQTARNFLEQHHIQGALNSGIKLGAFYQDTLVGVMTFSKLRRPLGHRDKQVNEFEMTRFSTVGSVPGLGNRMFQYFIRTYQPDRILSYCDLRWGSGTLYRKLGMAEKHTTQPNYWYSPDGWQREYRFNYTKSNLVKAGFDPQKTEKQIMEERGYLRIYDCGSILFEWTNPNSQ